jgi:hypothetical protein
MAGADRTKVLLRAVSPGISKHVKEHKSVFIISGAVAAYK